MKRRLLKLLIFVELCGFPAFYATAAVSLFSDYGQIQNVQNYSSNPFWSPNAPYNQRLPQPVYADGPDVKSGECSNIVKSLVAAQCMSRNNCKNTKISDIRPAIMVQLSNMSGKNYVSACGGYIDEIFNNYVRQYQNNIPSSNVAFPTATTPNPNTQSSTQPVTYTKPVAKWQKEINERAEELQSLQQRTGNDNTNNLYATDFPTTYQDRSFTDKMKDTVESYTPYKDLKAYKLPEFKSDDEWCPGHPDEPGCEAWNEAHNKTSSGSGNVPKTPSQFKPKHPESSDSNNSAAS